MTRLPLARSIRSDDSGVAVIELAAVLPILLLLLLGTIDLSRIIAAKLDLEQAAQRTTDFALAKRPSSSDASYLITEAATASGVPAQNVAVDIFLECNGIRQSTFGASCPTGQQRARFVSVGIVRDIEPVFNWAGLSGFLGFELPPTVAVNGDSHVRFQ